jgi:hypothetical protein
MDAIPIVVYRYAKSTPMQERRSVIEALPKHLKICMSRMYPHACWSGAESSNTSVSCFRSIEKRGQLDHSDTRGNGLS